MLRARSGGHQATEDAILLAGDTRGARRGVRGRSSGESKELGSPDGREGDCSIHDTSLPSFKACQAVGIYDRGHPEYDSMLSRWMVWFI